MNDPPPAFDQLNEANRQHATACGALTIALLDKGVISQEEYNTAYIQAQHIVSQEVARKRDEAQKAQGNPE